MRFSLNVASILMLEDVIYSISPTETPFLTMAARVEAKATLHE